MYLMCEPCKRTVENPTLGRHPKMGILNEADDSHQRENIKFSFWICHGCCTLWFLELFTDHECQSCISVVKRKFRWSVIELKEPHRSMLKREDQIKVEASTTPFTSVIPIAAEPEKKE